MERILETNDDVVNSSVTTNQMLSTLYLNGGVFIVLIIIFEACRSIKCLYLNRLTSRFIQSNRVPSKPSLYPFGWIPIILSIEDNEVLRMVGLDGYMLIRYLKICIKAGSFYSLLGLIVLVPIYSSSGRGVTEWSRFTLTNIPPSTQESPSNQLWAPVILCYIFAAYFCQLMFYEYKNFISKRIEYLSEKDYDTPDQTYYTIMIEKIPSDIKSTPALYEFFEKIFPGDIYSIELALDLKELDKLINERHEIRIRLEKSIAIATATNRRHLISIDKDFYKGIVGSVPREIESGYINKFGYILVDGVEHYTKVLEILNEKVDNLQKVYYQQRQVFDESDGLRLHQLTRVIENQTTNVIRSNNEIENPLKVVNKSVK